MNVLVGKVITAIYLAQDRQAIKFDVEGMGNPIVAGCDGDCCSVTWIEDVIDPEAVVGSVVTKVDDIDLPDYLQGKTKTDNYEEEMAYYGFAIETAKGRCTIAYRNSSNGYYGGSLNWPGEGYYYGGVFDENKSKEVWEKVA